jgi:hypothetical protein
MLEFRTWGESVASLWQASTRSIKREPKLVTRARLGYVLDVLEYVSGKAFLASVSVADGGNAEAETEGKQTRALADTHGESPFLSNARASYF